MLAYRRGDLVFVYNFSPFKSFDGYGILTPPGEYEVVLSSDNPAFGGYGNIDESVHHFTEPDPLYTPHGVAWLRLYLPARSAQVLRLVRKRPGRKPGVKAATAAEKITAAKKTAATKKPAEKKPVAKKATAKKTEDKSAKKAGDKPTAKKPSTRRSAKKPE